VSKSYLGIPDNKRTRQDQGLSERGREQARAMPARPETRHGGTDDPHNGHSEIHYGGRMTSAIGLSLPKRGENDAANATPTAARYTVASTFLVTSSYVSQCEEESADKHKGAKIPVPSTQQGDQQEERCD